ncbi:MAG: TonB-dependent receptor [Gallionella sp.]|nr:TonB-dependent receptor [Gallionella sp.]
MQSEDAFLQSFPVVLSASRLSQPQADAPNAVTVIDRDMIVASGFRNIADLFRLVPGMYVSYYKGAQPIVSYHGSTDQYARRMQVMIDGRSVYLPPLSMVEWSNFPITLNDIERIEVIRGPAAASHGANSLQGVISIITRDAGGLDGQTVSFTRGDKGVNDVSAHFGRRGEVLDYRMTLAYTADNGYDDLKTVPNNLLAAIPMAANVLNNSNDSNQARMVNFRANYHPDDVDSVDMQFGLSHDKQGVGFSDSRANPMHDLVADSSFLQLQWLRQLGDASELKFSYSHSGQSQDEDFMLVTAPFAGHRVIQSVDVQRDEIEMQHMLPVGDAHRLVYGAGWRRDRTTAQGYTTAMLLFALPVNYGSSLSQDEYRLFAHDEWRISPAFLLNTGGMLERDRMGRSSVSPRVSLNVYLNPQHSVRMGMSVAHRTPSLVEERFQSVPQPGHLFIPDPAVTSPGLVPERVVSREVGYLAEFLDWDASLDIRVFSDQIGNGIYVSAGRFMNGISSRYYGTEATLKSLLGKDGELTINFSHQRASSNVVALAGLAGDVLVGSIPRISASVLYSQRLENDLVFSAAYYHQDAMQPYDRGPTDFQPAQDRADVRLAKTFKLETGINGEVSWVIQNLFNNSYTEYIVNNLSNRRSHVNLTLNW